MDINIGIKSLASLQPFVERVGLADSEHSIMTSLVYKMEHSDRVCREFIKHGLKEYMFL